ncbi:MAG: hypothetical protein IJ816_00415 [Alloprevotella sp.]|nr:hypothetical protein [Alloprevotella sp.]
MGFWKDVKEEWTTPKNLIWSAILLDCAIIWFGRTNVMVLILSILLFVYLCIAYYLINKKEN